MTDTHRQIEQQLRAEIADKDRQLAQQAGQIGALSAIIDQLNDDMNAYRPDMHPVVRTGLELAMTYKRTLLEQPANRSLARELAKPGSR